MKRTAPRTIGLSSFALVVMLPAAWQAPAQEAKTPYPSMCFWSRLDGGRTERLLPKRER
jgi:hypothetical protein